MARLEAQLEAARGDLAKLDRREQEWRETLGILKDLPGKVRHPIMVPFGPLAFFPGYLEHTSEVTCQLSTEWFALRTVKHAEEMARRRMAHCSRERDNIKKRMRELQMLGGVAGENAKEAGAVLHKDVDGFIDIREPCDENGDVLSAQPAAVAPGPSGSAAAGPRAGGDVLARMRDLEGLEAAEEPCGTHGDSAANAATLARLRDLERLEAMEELDNLMEEAELAAESPGHVDGTGERVAREAEAVARSPADLFRAMQQVEAAAERVALPPALVPAPTGAVAAAPLREELPERLAGDLRGSVCERSVQVGAAPSSGTGQQMEAPKRVSKFKADRQRSAG